MATINDKKYTKDGDLSHFGKALLNKQIQKTTWSKLKAARDSSILIPGCVYRITDYYCTTIDSISKSAGHRFDILIEATNVNTLSEVCKCCKHEFADDEINPFTGQLYTQDEKDYFNNVNVDAWVVWYNIDNDQTKYAWATNNAEYIDFEFNGYPKYLTRRTDYDVTGKYAWVEQLGTTEIYAYFTTTETPVIGTTFEYTKLADSSVLNTETATAVNVVPEGHGVIYRMIDDFNNDIAYDFKSIMFLRDADFFTTYVDFMDVNHWGLNFYYTLNNTQTVDNVKYAIETSTHTYDVSVAKAHDNTIEALYFVGYPVPRQWLNDIILHGAFINGNKQEASGNKFYESCFSITLLYPISNTFKGFCNTIIVGNGFSNYNNIARCNNLFNSKSYFQYNDIKDSYNLQIHRGTFAHNIIKKVYNCTLGDKNDPSTSAFNYNIFEDCHDSTIITTSQRCYINSFSNSTVQTMQQCRINSNIQYSNIPRLARCVINCTIKYVNITTLNVDNSVKLVTFNSMLQGTDNNNRLTLQLPDTMSGNNATFVDVDSSDNVRIYKPTDLLPETITYPPVGSGTIVGSTVDMELQSNKYYKFTQDVTTMQLTLADSPFGAGAEHHFTFTAGANMTLTMPSGIIWANNTPPPRTQGKTYEVHVFNKKYATYLEY